MFVFEQADSGQIDPQMPRKRKTKQKERKITRNCNNKQISNINLSYNFQQQIHLI